MECKNCGTALSGRFCAECGQKVIDDRLTLRPIFIDLFAIITNVEKGFWHTALRLFQAPGDTIRAYLSGKTVRYYHPLRYLVIWVTFSVALNLSLGLYDRQQQDMKSIINTPTTEKSEAVQQQIQNEVKKYLNIIPLAMVPFLSLMSYLFFIRRGWNYAEHLVLNAYTQGQMAMIGLPIMLLSIVAWNTDIVFSIAMVISILYGAYVYKTFFKVGILQAIIKNILVHLFGYLIVTILFFVITVIWILFRL